MQVYCIYANSQSCHLSVTAQKRAENLQEVPLSITALSSEVLEQRAVQSFADYGNRIPNLGFANTGDGIGASRTISIRGISGDGVTGFYLDETPLPESIDPRIVDLGNLTELETYRGALALTWRAMDLVKELAPRRLTSAGGQVGIGGVSGSLKYKQREHAQ
jgi:hypothetical protein